MRAPLAAATGLVVGISTLGSPTGPQSPKPLLTTVPPHP